MKQTHAAFLAIAIILAGSSLLGRRLQEAQKAPRSEPAPAITEGAMFVLFPTGIGDDGSPCLTMGPKEVHWALSGYEPLPTSERGGTPYAAGAPLFVSYGIHGVGAVSPDVNRASDACSGYYTYRTQFQRGGTGYAGEISTEGGLIAVKLNGQAVPLQYFGRLVPLPRPSEGRVYRQARFRLDPELLHDTNTLEVTAMHRYNRFQPAYFDVRVESKRS